MSNLGRDILTLQSMYLSFGVMKEWSQTGGGRGMKMERVGGILKMRPIAYEIVSRNCWIVRMLSVGAV
jgi:hypothetical protein